LSLLFPEIHAAVILSGFFAAGMRRMRTSAYRKILHRRVKHIAPVLILLNDNAMLTPLGRLSPDKNPYPLSSPVESTSDDDIKANLAAHMATSCEMYCTQKNSPEPHRGLVQGRHVPLPHRTLADHRTQEHRNIPPAITESSDMHAPQPDLTGSLSEIVSVGDRPPRRFDAADRNLYREGLRH
jgi:hypothetical protein